MRVDSAGFMGLLFAMALVAPASVHAQLGALPAEVVVVVGASGVQHVTKLEGGSLAAKINLQKFDPTGLQRKSVASGLVADDTRLTFSFPNKAFLALVDAFFDNRVSQVDLSLLDDTSREQGHIHLRDAQIVSITAAADAASTSDCSFVVTLQAASLVETAGSAQPISVAAASGASPSPQCSQSGVRMSIDGVNQAFSRLDSVELRSDWRFGDTRTGYTYANLRVTTPLGQGGELDAWRERTIVNGQLSANQARRRLSLSFLDGSLAGAPLLQLDATGVMMVARRRVITGLSSTSTLTYELAIEQWRRASRTVASPSAGPGTSPSAGSGAAANSPPASASSGAAKGSFRIALPDIAITGTGSICLVGETNFVMQLSGDGGVGLITGDGIRLNTGTFPVAAEGTPSISAGFTRSDVGVNAFTAKSGMLTISKVGKSVSGSLTITADGVSEKGATSDHTITARFTDLPLRC